MLLFSSVFIHTDHLGGTNVVSTNSTTTVAEVNDYYPYGGNRVNEHPLSFDTTRKYIGEDYDVDSSYNYLNARYLSGTQGQFISQDPVFLSTQQNLNDPQSLNSYSYANDNPINKSDPSGKFWWYGFYDWRGYNGIQGVAMKLGEVFGGHERGLNAISSNSSNVAQSSSQYGVDQNLVNAIIYEEQSHLMPDEALGREQAFPNLGSGGVGTMQVSGPIGKEFGGYSKAELARDPKKNIDSGTAYLQSISQKNGANNYAAIGQQYNGNSAYGQRINAQLTNPNYNKNVFMGAGSFAVSSFLQAFSAVNSAQQSAVQGVLSAFGLGKK